MWIEDPYCHSERSEEPQCSLQEILHGVYPERSRMVQNDLTPQSELRNPQSGIGDGTY